MIAVLGQTLVIFVCVHTVNIFIINLYNMTFLKYFFKYHTYLIMQTVGGLMCYCKMTATNMTYALLGP